MGGVDDDLLLALGFEIREEHVVVVRHDGKLAVDLADVLLDKLEHVANLLLAMGLLFQH